MNTITYERVGNLDIKLDLCIPPSATAGEVLPAVIYFHGGGLLSGCRTEEDVYFPFWLKGSTLRRGLIFTAADHRLSPPSTALHDIEDVKTLFSFLARPTFSKYLPNGISLNASRLAVAGFSGGGYVARVTGIYAEPRAKAVLSMFGMGGNFWSDHHWLAVKDIYFAFPGANKVTHETVAHLFDPSIAPVAEAPLKARSYGSLSDDQNRWFCFMDAWRNGNLLDLVFGEPVSVILRSLPYAERLAAISPRLRRAAILEDQINTAFPPTCFVNGAIDHIVLSSESKKTYRRLRELGVATELVIIPDADHDLITRSAPPLPAPGSDETQERGMDFIERMLRE